MIVLALLVASTASALPTKLCQTNEASCSKGNTWTLSGEPEDFESAVRTTVKLQMGSLLTISCTAGKLGFALSEGTGALTGEVSKWNFTVCSPEGCVIASPKGEATGYTAELAATTGGNGTITIGNTPVLEGRCSTSPPLTCVYRAASVELPLQGGSTLETAGISPKVKLSKEIFASNFSCPESATYEGSYFIVAPGTPIYATH